MVFDSDNKQITFAAFDDEEEEIVDETQHYRDLVTEMRMIMKRIKITPNENFPEFLWNPNQNDFSEGQFRDTHMYLKMGLGMIEVENGAEIMRSVSQMNTRKKDYFDYVDSLEIWERYYDFIVETYGSFKTFVEMVDNGETELPLVKKPKLKKAKKNRHLLELKVPVSRIDRSLGVSDEMLKQLGSELPDQFELYEDYEEYSKYLHKYNKKEEHRLQRKSRMGGFYKVTSVSNNDDAILEYLSNPSKISDNGIPKTRGLCEDVEIMHEYDGYPEDIKERMLGLHRTVVIDQTYGHLRETSTHDNDMDVLTALNEGGWDVGGIIQNSGMDKKAKKMYSSEFGCLEEVSPKKAKKMKKKREKAERVLYDTLSSNESIRNILSKNRVEFDAAENMITFTSKDVFG